MRAQLIGLRLGDRELLESWTRPSSIRAGFAARARIFLARARIVLLAADGVSNTEISKRVGMARQTVISWRDRYWVSGIGGLEDERRLGRPRTVDRAKILAATLTPPPARLRNHPLVRRGYLPTISTPMHPWCCGPGGTTKSFWCSYATSPAATLTVSCI